MEIVKGQVNSSSQVKPEQVKVSQCGKEQKKDYKEKPKVEKKRPNFKRFILIHSDSF